LIAAGLAKAATGGNATTLASASESSPVRVGGVPADTASSNANVVTSAHKQEPPPHGK